MGVFWSAAPNSVSIRCDVRKAQLNTKTGASRYTAAEAPYRVSAVGYGA